LPPGCALCGQVCCQVGCAAAAAVQQRTRHTAPPQHLQGGGGGGGGGGWGRGMGMMESSFTKEGTVQVCQQSLSPDCGPTVLLILLILLLNRSLPAFCSLRTVSHACCFMQPATMLLRLPVLLGCVSCCFWVLPLLLPTLAPCASLPHLSHSPSVIPAVALPAAPGVPPHCTTQRRQQQQRRCPRHTHSTSKSP
jgi:hypothetical protein